MRRRKEVDYIVGKKSNCLIVDCVCDWIATTLIFVAIVKLLNKEMLD